MHSLAVKIVSLTSLFVLTFISGVVPVRLRRTTDGNDPSGRQERTNARRRRIISLSTCFAGGAFFASSMLELLPMVRREFRTVLKNANIKTDFPLPEFGISMGFFLILTVEQIIHVMKEKRMSVTVNGFEDSEGHTSPLIQNGGNVSTVEYGATDFQKHLNNEIKEVESEESDEESHENSHGQDDTQRPRVYSLESEINDQHGHHDVTHQHGEDDEDHHHTHDHKHQNHRHYLRSYLLLIALSIHALFEGLAVGLFQNIDSMIELLGALIIHKCILAFSIGINLVQHGFPKIMIIKSAILFSAMSPIGLGFGILLLKFTTEYLGHILSAIFQAIATGTFLYVTFFEIFFHELNSKECHKLLKVLMMICGFAIITVVQYFDTKINR